MKFGEIINSEFIGSYVKCKYSDDYINKPEYIEFIKKVKINTINSIISILKKS